MRIKIWLLVLSILFIISCRIGDQVKPELKLASVNEFDMLIKARYILTGEGVIENGFITIDNCKITAISKNKPNVNAKVEIIAASHIISPGFINCHDHLSNNHMFPAHECQSNYAETHARYDQQNDWRKGKRGHKQIFSETRDSQTVVAWNELRQLISGTTTVVSKGGTKGFLRNLGNEKPNSRDLDNRREGLISPRVYYETFPLGTYNGEQYESGINYPRHPNPGDLKDLIYVAHLSEGVDQTARNEFLNVSTNQTGTYMGTKYQSADILGNNIILIHLIAMLREDAELAALKNVNFVWSPRSNISLYGNTAYVTLYKALGMNICLSTDWICSGSMNILREFALVCDFNEKYLDNTFSNKELWQMVTVNAARALQVEGQIGDIQVGAYADLMAVRISSTGDPYKSVIKAPIANIALTMRSGKIIYGDENLIGTVPPNPNGEWEHIIVNGIDKLVDCKSEIEITLAQLQACNQDNYPLFFNGAPPDEPGGKPVRAANPQCPTPIGISPLYPITEDYDRDGVRNELDNAPRIFNPVRPVDCLNGMEQCEINPGKGKIPGNQAGKEGNVKKRRF